MARLANFVYGRLTAGVSDSAVTVPLTVEAPWNAFPAPGQQFARALLADDLRRPTRFEIVTYTGTTGTSLNGVTRGADGTTAQSWSEGAYITQDLSAAYLGPLGIQPATAREVLKYGSGNFESGHVAWNELANKPWFRNHMYLEAQAEPATPDSGESVLYLDSADGALKKKFDDGTVVLLAPIPPPTFELADSTENDAISSAVVLDAPTNISEGDLILILAATFSPSSVVNTPSGFTLIVNDGSTGSGKGNIYAFYKIATDSEPATYNVTTVDGTFIQASGHRITGASQTNPIKDTSSDNTDPTTVTDIDIPSLAVAKSLVIAAAGLDGSPGTITHPSGFTAVPEGSQTTNMMAYREYDTEGVTGAINYAWTNSREAACIGFSINNFSVS